MPAPAYASTDDLAAWLEADAPDNASLLLRSAAYAVREATSTAFYAADPTTGLPTDATVAAAFKAATCAQAAALAALDVDPNLGGTIDTAVETSIAIGSGKVEYADSAYAAKSRIATLTGLCLDAARELKMAGIQLGVVWTVG